MNMGQFSIAFKAYNFKTKQEVDLHQRLPNDTPVHFIPHINIEEILRYRIYQKLIRMFWMQWLDGGEIGVYG